MPSKSRESYDPLYRKDKNFPQNPAFSDLKEGILASPAIKLTAHLDLWKYVKI